MMSQRRQTPILPGLVSITFRKRTPREIVDLVVQARLSGIEWGGDIHVPHGDLTRAAEVGQMTREAGLAVAAYGSYYVIGKSEADGLSFTRVQETALTLGAPVIHVWAGDRSSADADEAYRQRVTDEANRIATEAASAGLTVAFEFHARTLTDTTASAAALLAATAKAGARSYWQPPVGWSPEERAAALTVVLPRLAHLHVFQWHTAADRRPLAEGAEEWLSYFKTTAAAVAHRSDPCWALLEFVRQDDPVLFAADAEVLSRLLVQAAPDADR